MSTSGAGLLEGIRIVEIGSSDAVRIAGMLAADLGADVVRIEQPVPEQNRPFHKVTDRAKGVVRCNPEQGHAEAAKTLISRADVLLEDLGPELQTRLNVDKKILSSVIHCAVTPFSDNGNQADRSWSDETVSAVTGLYEPLGGIGVPKFFDLPIASTLAALHAINAIAMALAGRARSGRGCSITVPIDRCALFAQVFGLMIRSKAPVQWEPFRMWASPFMGIWKTAGDGYIYLHVGMPRHLRTFLFLLDSLGFTDAKNAVRRSLRKTSKRDPVLLGGVREAFGITAILKKLFLMKTALEWEELLGNAGLCCTKIRSFEEWLNHPQVMQTGEVVECRMPDGSSRSSLKVPGPLFVSNANPFGGVAAPCLKTETGFERLLEQWPEKKSELPAGKESLPLKGIRVLDLSRVIAGPYTGRLLAEYGADVLSLSLRKDHLSWEEPFHVVFNAGKDSVCIDYASPAGKAAFRKILDEYNPDVIVHNFLDDAAQKLGVDYESCRKRNEKIVYVDIKGFNRDGPWASRPGFEQNIQAASGILHAYSSGSIPRILPVPVNDLCTGLIASIGAALSLLHVFKGKGGNRVTSFLSMSSILLQAACLNKNVPESALEYCKGYYRASDGWFLLSARRDALARLAKITGCKGLDREGLDPDRDSGNRGDKLTFAKKPVQWWIEQVRAIETQNLIRIVPRKKLAAILAEELAKPDPLFCYKRHDGLGDLLFARSPVIMNSFGGMKELSPAPFIGSSTAAYTGLTGVVSRTSSTGQSTSGLFAAMGRAQWLLSQCSWLAVIAFRQLSLKRAFRSSHR